MADFTGTLSAGATLSSPGGRYGVMALRVVDFGLRDYALTCAHVVAPPWSEVLHAPIDSPAITEGPAGNRVFGTLHHWSKLRSGFELGVDAALIKPGLNVRLSNEPLQLGEDPRHVKPTASAFLTANPGAVRLEIFTGRGRLEAEPEGFCDKEIMLRNKIYSFSQVLRYRADVEPGDSGSAVVDRASRCVVGIHFAGQKPKTGYSIPIEKILGLFAEYELTIPAF